MDAVNVNANIRILPEAAILIVLGVGCVLAVFRPGAAYLSAVFLSIALPIPTMTFTRLNAVGAYFNLYDACAVVVVGAVGSEIIRRRRVPKVAAVTWGMLASVVLGACITANSFGWSYETLRALRWALNVPLFAIAGSVMLSDRRYDKGLLIALLMGALCAEVQHLYFVARTDAIYTGKHLGDIRSSMFQLSKSHAWLLAGPLSFSGTWLVTIANLGVGGLFLTAAITTQTRTVALGLAGGLLIYGWWFVRPDREARKRYVMGVIIVFAVTSLVVVPGLGLGGTVESFTDRLRGVGARASMDESAWARWVALSIESGDWMNGSVDAILFGNGLGYFDQKYYVSSGDLSNAVAFGHVGYVTYLSQLGVCGFVIYACWFPAVVLKNAYGLYSRTARGITKHLIALAAATFIYDAVSFVFSGHYLVNDVLSGTLAGFVLAVKRSRHRTRS